MTADQKYYPGAAMTLAHSAALHGVTAITFLGYTRNLQHVPSLSYLRQQDKQKA